MSVLKSAGYAAIPWLCATIADLVVGGWLIDHLIQRGYDETPVRKIVLVLAMLLGLAVFGATFTTDPLWAIFWISIALSGLAPFGATFTTDPLWAIFWISIALSGLAAECRPGCGAMMKKGPLPNP